MQKALRYAWTSKIPTDDPTKPYEKLTEGRLIEILDLKETKADALYRFRCSDLPAPTDVNMIGSITKQPYIKSFNDASKLWNFLYKNRYIHDAMRKDPHPYDKRDMYTDYDLPCVFSGFFNAHTSQIASFTENGLSEEAGQPAKTWFLYKVSFKHFYSIVKSQFTIRNVDNRYFEIEDIQMSTGRQEQGGGLYREVSKGFGVSKSDRLWCVLEENEQPRIMCFHKAEMMVQTTNQDTDTKKLSYMAGYVIETNNGKETTERPFSGFAHSPVILVSPEYEKQSFFYNKMEGYTEEKQFDIHPLDPKKRAHGVYIPDIVIQELFPSRDDFEQS